MEAVKCPNCGNGNVKELTEDKYYCLACDNVFLVHNLSKEFQKTDEHITQTNDHIANVHQDLKEDIQKLVKGSQFDEAAMLKKAEGHLKMEDWDTAGEIYENITNESPQHSAGWYGLYRTLTGDFAAVGRYALFVCDGNYVDDGDKEAGQNAFFYGNGYIKRALSCEDADRETITERVSSFIKECAEYGKQDIEESIRQIIDEFEQMRHDLDITRAAAKNEKTKDKVKTLIPAIVVLALAALCVMYFRAAGDWLGKLIGIIGILAVFKFGIKHIVNSIRNLKVVEAEWNDTLLEAANPLVDDMDEQVNALKAYCIDLDNYNTVLNALSDKKQFISDYVECSIEGLKDYSQASENDERFVFDLLAGKIERYRYLVPDAQMNAANEPKQNVVQMLSRAGGQRMAEMIKRTVGQGMTEMMGHTGGADQQGQFCPACGSRVESGDRFCMKCGSAL